MIDRYLYSVWQIPHSHTFRNSVPFRSWRFSSLYICQYISLYISQYVSLWYSGVRYLGSPLYRYLTEESVTKLEVNNSYSRSASVSNWSLRPSVCLPFYDFITVNPRSCELSPLSGWKVPAVSCYSRAHYQFPARPPPPCLPTCISLQFALVWEPPCYPSSFFWLPFNPASAGPAPLAWARYFVFSILLSPAFVIQYTLVTIHVYCTLIWRILTIVYFTTSHEMPAIIRHCAYLKSHENAPDQYQCYWLCNIILLT